MSKKIGVGVLGAGHWGKNHVRNMHELESAQLEVVCDSSGEARERTAKLYPGVRVVEDPAAVLRDPEVDAVVIATPAETHYNLCMAAMDAGKDALVEKPLSLKVSEGARIAARAEADGRVVMVGHLLEYHAHVRKLLELVQAGDLGRLQYLYSNRLNLGKLRKEENILWSFAPHDIGIILRMIGEMPFEVSAIGAAYVRPNIADTTVTHLLFDNGIRAHIYVSWLHPYKDQRLVVVGSEKMAVFDDVAQEDKLLLHDKSVEWVNGEAVPRKGLGTPVPVDSGEPLREECQHFLDCVVSRERPYTDARWGLRVLKILNAAQRSLVTQGRPVQLPLEDDEWL